MLTRTELEFNMIKPFNIEYRIHSGEIKIVFRIFAASNYSYSASCIKLQKKINEKYIEQSS